MYNFNNNSGKNVQKQNVSNSSNSLLNNGFIKEEEYSGYFYPCQKEMLLENKK